MPKKKNDNVEDVYAEFRDPALFEVFNRDGTRVLFSNKPLGIIDQSTVNNCSKAGHKFKIKNKVVAKNNVMNELKKIEKELDKKA